MPQCPTSHYRSWGCKGSVDPGGLRLGPRLRRIDCVAFGPGDNLGGICDDGNNVISTFGASPELTGRPQVLRSPDGRIPQTQVCADATEESTGGRMALEKLRSGSNFGEGNVSHNTGTI